MNETLPENFEFTAGSARMEYAPLSQEKTTAWMNVVQDEIEFLFMNVPANRSGGYSRDDESFLRQTFLNGRALPIKRDEPVWLYNTSEGTIEQYEHAFNPTHLHVELRHMNMYNHPVVNEEYAVKLEKYTVGATGPFVTFYRFVQYKGGTWEAQVERNNIDPFLEGVPISRYVRTMTEYDFVSFMNEMEEVELSYMGERVHMTVPRSAV